MTFFMAYTKEINKSLAKRLISASKFVFFAHAAQEFFFS
jgi:hypothetical protein